MSALRMDYTIIDEDVVCACDCESNGDAVFLYHGSRFVLFRVLGEDDATYDKHDLYSKCEANVESQRPTEELFGESYLWDVHFVGSIIAANGAYWEVDRCDNEARRRYWLRWLDETLPVFLGDIRQARIRASLEE